jgi:hypothetical protein
MRLRQCEAVTWTPQLQLFAGPYRTGPRSELAFSSAPTTQDIAPFDIQTTMIEPGGARTAIFDAGRLVHGPALSAYASTAARQIRELLESGTYVPSGDPVKMMQAVIDSADLAEATKRLA